MMGSPDPQVDKLRERGGLTARGLISAAKAGKEIKASDPGQPAQVMWKLTVRVFPDDRGPFNAVVKMPYPKQAGGPPIGSSVGVLYDPKDHNNVVIDQTAPTESWGTVQSKAMSRVMPPGAQVQQGPLVIAGGQVVMPPPTNQPASVAEQLEQLAQLKERGVLTESEFQAQKQKLLGT